MSWRMLFSVLRRQAMMPALVMLQVMLACAILCNVMFMAWQRLAPMLAPSGVDQDNLILVTGLSPAHGTWPAGAVASGLVNLRQIPGVDAASAAIGLPMVTGMITSMALEGPGGAKVGVTTFSGKGLVDTLGMKLVAGRDFRPSEYFTPGKKPAGAGAIIITRALATQLFPDGHAAGKLVHVPRRQGATVAYRVVGVLAHLLRNRLGTVNSGHGDNTVLIPSTPTTMPFISLAVRAAPTDHAATLKAVRRVIKTHFDSLMPPGTTPKVAFYNTRANAAFASRRHALWLFAGIAVMVLAVTVMGIMGLTGFWIQRRTRQIGIQRALGAKRHQILRQFMAENALIVALAILAGMILAYAGNRLLMNAYELDRLPLIYLPVGAAIMLILGQLAVLGPALRAARVPPALATRGAL